jgi:hypothetical protein
MAAFIPIFASIGARRTAAHADADADADACRRLEEGEHVSPQPNVRGVSEATRRFVKIAMMVPCLLLGIYFSAYYSFPLSILSTVYV